ncbi:MAG: hypothetical protein M1838_003985 [Thelocarpon superellum]|nr:MAG: hypothetical protein M1838_003985 [Thelocarpon superellum]
MSSNVLDSKDLLGRGKEHATGTAPAAKNVSPSRLPRPGSHRFAKPVGQPEDPQQRPDRSSRRRTIPAHLSQADFVCPPSDNGKADGKAPDKADLKESLRKPRGAGDVGPAANRFHSRTNSAVTGTARAAHQSTRQTSLADRGVPPSSSSASGTSTKPRPLSLLVRGRADPEGAAPEGAARQSTSGSTLHVGTSRVAAAKEGRSSTESRSSVRVPSDASIKDSKPSTARDRASLRRGEDDEPSSRPSRPSAVRAAPGPAKPVKTSKPGFSTLQQHFTPKKATRQPSASAPAGAELAADARSAEVARQQTRLLQLHLLHSTFEDTYRQWRLSAKHESQERFEWVSRTCQELEAVERQEQENLNIRALRRWAEASPVGLGLEEKTQTLGPPLQDLMSLTDVEGKHTRLRGRFERWVGWAQDVWVSREAGCTSDEGNDELPFVQPLGDDWFAQSHGLSRRVTTHQRALDMLEEPLAGSSLWRVVMGSKSMVSGVLEELDLMRQIHDDMMAREHQWLDTQMQHVARDLDQDVNGVDAAVGARRGIWTSQAEGRRR